ncbi:MAG: sugar transporter [Sphingobacteriaceae bacterium]|nr:sugar transporter [Sphingobacteriaceae bacterium]
MKLHSKNMLRKYISGLLFLLFSFGFLNAQKQYVTWTYSQKKISADEFELSFKAKIEPTWHLYSQIESIGETVPLPTIFEFDKSKDYKLIGKTSEPKPIEHAEPVFDNAVMRYFENTATSNKNKSLNRQTFCCERNN